VNTSRAAIIARPVLLSLVGGIDDRQAWLGSIAQFDAFYEIEIRVEL
jgi:hypothetical protein